ncbi:MAG: hypothetical protein AUJ92_04675 [Armatimonadetes bacterium CG2_30_59_28]|nr:MAG: hypothetical protein AUJ92_04675 [Armatimonadetes bacterium CG2_30_59_28]
MLTGLVVTVGISRADIVGTTNREIQAAADRVAARGGGEVRLGAGVYTMEDSLHLRSKVRIVGQGEKTVLRKCPSVSSPLSADLGYGHFDVSLAEPDRFRVGMGVHIQDDRSGGFYGTVATLTWRDGDRFGISRMLNHDYGRHANAIVQSVFPIISGYRLKDAAVKNLTVDGNKDASAYLNGCRGGGVFLLQAHNVKLNRLRVRNDNGDGISFQQCRSTHIENCLLEENAGLGLHPGSGSVGAVMRGNTCRNNGSDGIFYCLRVSYSLCENNTIESNGGYGISIGGRDTDHLIRKNTIRGNGKAGVYFREGDLAMGGSRNQIEANIIEGNCQKEGDAEIQIDGESRDIHILRNIITPGTRGTTASAVLVGPKCERVVIFGNEVKGDHVTAINNKAPDGAVTTTAPDKPLAVGPTKAPNEAAAHLGNE